MLESKRLSRRDALRITGVAGISAVAGGTLLRDLIRQSRLHRVRETRVQMGTVVTVTMVHPDRDAAREMVLSSFSEMARLEDILSRHRTDTALGQLNATGRLAEAPADLLQVLGQAQVYSRMSDGAFDVTTAPLLDLYERSFASGEAPTHDEIQSAVALVDYRGVRVEGAGVSFADPRMSVTLDGIAKGYIVDRTIDVLVSRGAERVLVDAGGDMSAGGPGSLEEPWTVSIQDPADSRAFVDLVRLGGECIATSGDYMSSFTEDRSFHHIVDPRTGYSPPHSASVSVVAPTAMAADALSTAVLVLGPEAGADLLRRVDGAEGVIVAKSGERVRTAGMRSRTIPA